MFTVVIPPEMFGPNSSGYQRGIRTVYPRADGADFAAEGVFDAYVYDPNVQSQFFNAGSGLGVNAFSFEFNLSRSSSIFQNNAGLQPAALRCIVALRF